MAGCILATRIAEKGVNPNTGERLKIAILERGPYFKGDPRPGYGIPLRRKMFTNISHEFREGLRYSMGFFGSRYDVTVADPAHVLRFESSGGGFHDVCGIQIVGTPPPSAFANPTLFMFK